MRLLRKNVVVLIALLMVFNGVLAQNEVLYKKYLDKYPGKDAAALEMHGKIDFELVNGVPEITYSTSEELIYIGKKPDQTERRSVPSSRFMELKSVKAFVLTPDNGRYKSNEVQDFQTSTLGDLDIFYDDSKELSFNLAGLERGSKSIIRSEYKILDPHMIPSMHVPPYIPVEKCVFEITYPSSLDIGITELNFGSSVESFETVKGKKTTKTYVFTDFTGPDNEGDGPDWRYFTPQVHVRLKTYQSKEKSVNVLRNVNDLHTWYCGFLDQSKETISDFKSLSDSIVLGSLTDREKAEKLYSWVQSNIRYIAIEDGYMGYIPQKASLVCHNRYGDCKGMSNLLWYLMMAQNLPAHHAWVGTRTLPYSYEKMASPVVDNHMVVCYKENGKNLFLDPTHARLPFGIPSPFIQDKESMVTNNCESFEVVRVPIVPAENNLLSDSVWVRLEGNKLIGEGRAVLTGHLRMSFLDRVNPQDPKPFLDFCRSYFAKGSNKFIMDTIWAENISDPNKDLIVNYRFNNPDYAITAGDELYVNLNLDKQNGPEKIKKDRKVSVEYKFAMRYINTVVFEVPTNLIAKEVPADFHLDKKVFTFHNSYRKLGNKVIRQTIQDRFDLSILPVAFEAWNEFYKHYSSQSNIQTVLTAIK